LGDAYVKGDLANTNYGSETDLLVKAAKTGRIINIKKVCLRC